jgi:hypothetical protein
MLATLRPYSLSGSDPRRAFSPHHLVWAEILAQDGNFPPIRQFDPTLPAELERLISIAVRANPMQRPKADWGVEEGF